MPYDTNLEVVTKDHRKLLLAGSGKIELGRPDKLRATRMGGFAKVEMVFDGETVALFGKDANLYTQVEVPGTGFSVAHISFCRSALRCSHWMVARNSVENRISSVATAAMVGLRVSRTPLHI